jgi:FtsP/CotA-like multicopper oxidase with cupredoxin domain
VLAKLECKAGDSDAPCWYDPMRFFSNHGLSDIQRTHGRAVLHDTFPVPPAETNDQGNVLMVQDPADPSNLVAKNPGRVFLLMGFRSPEQIGRYVYHCHILEHEDGGMMAPIEVLDLRGTRLDHP